MLVNYFYIKYLDKQNINKQGGHDEDVKQKKLFVMIV